MIIKYCNTYTVAKIQLKRWEGGSFANFRQICFDFAYYFILILYLSNCLIRCVCKKSFLSFSYFSMVIKKIHHFGITKRKVMASKLQVTPTKLQVTRSKLTSLTAETDKFQLTNMLFITF